MSDLTEKSELDPSLPVPPAGLKASGLELWRSIVETYDLRADELAVLAAACQLTDEISTFEAALVDAPTLVSGSMGQVRPNPLYAEVRAHRLALGRMLAQLGLVNADDMAATKRSAAGRRMAIARWAGR